MESGFLPLPSFSENPGSDLCEGENWTRWTKSLGISKVNPILFLWQLFHYRGLPAYCVLGIFVKHCINITAEYRTCLKGSSNVTTSFGSESEKSIKFPCWRTCPGKLISSVSVLETSGRWSLRQCVKKHVDAQVCVCACWGKEWRREAVFPETYWSCFFWLMSVVFLER